MPVHCVQKVDFCVVCLPYSSGNISYQRVMTHKCLPWISSEVLAIYMTQFLETLVILDRSLQLVVSSFFSI